MNRLVIIGNGFDLAHGLPTSYRNFIDDYWKNIKDSNHNELVEFDIGSYTEFNGHQNLNDLIDLIVNVNGNFRKRGIEVFRLVDFPQPSMDNRIQILHYKNRLFKLINENIIENWVDIENEYYKKLKIIVKSASLTNKEKKKETIILNLEFEQVKNLLEIYLKEQVEERYDFKLFRGNPINHILLPELENRFDEIEYLKEYQYGDQIYVKEFLDKSKEKYDLITHFLNFNYTKVTQQYFDGFAYPKQLNYIHGKLNDSINAVNFGFGDEMDDDYRTIENINDNEYLRNFKSFQYLQNPNYKSLLDFVESDRKFQVYIMGHSCGLSDRTMLNTIFEHPNCISIKVFYHQNEGGGDNYTEIIQNISRHFSKKKLMREKIVNKTLCQPLPQSQFPLK